MKWLVVLFLINGEPAMDLDGWQPLQVADCEQAKAMVTKQLLASGMVAVGCMDALTQANIDALINSIGEAT